MMCRSVARKQRAGMSKLAMDRNRVQEWSEEREHQDVIADQCVSLSESKETRIF